MNPRMRELIEALEMDTLPKIREILAEGDIDLDSDLLIGEEYDMDEPDEIPLLFYVIMKNVSLEAIKLLIDAGMSLQRYTREGVGALDIAIKFRRMDIVELCAENGISLTQSRRKSGMTPLMLAASFNDMEMIRFLIERGADPEAVDKYGMNALEYARKLGQERVREYLEELKRC